MSTYRENGGSGAEIVPTAEFPWYFRDLALVTLVCAGLFSLSILLERVELAVQTELLAAGDEPVEPVDQARMARACRVAARSVR